MLDKIVSKKDKIQDININLLKFEIHDSQKIDEKNNKLRTSRFRRSFK